MPSVKTTVEREVDYERLYDKSRPTPRLRAAIREAKIGRGKTFTSAKDFMAHLESCAKKSR
jgi:hypothetical protein